jgi:hypothetical protein
VGGFATHVTSAPGAWYGIGKGSESSRESTPRFELPLLLCCELDDLRDKVGTFKSEPSCCSRSRSSLDTRCLLNIRAFSSAGKSSRSKGGIIGVPLPDPLPVPEPFLPAAPLVPGTGFVLGRKGELSFPAGVEERAGEAFRSGMLREVLGGVPEY